MNYIEIKAYEHTFVMRHCMIKKWGLLTLSWTLWNIFSTSFCWQVRPFKMYLFFPPITI